MIINKVQKLIRHKKSHLLKKMAFDEKYWNINIVR